MPTCILVYSSCAYDPLSQSKSLPGDTHTAAGLAHITGTVDLGK